MRSGNNEAEERILQAVISNNHFHKSGNTAAQTLYGIYLTGLRIDAQIIDNRLDLFYTTGFDYFYTDLEDSSTVSWSHRTQISVDEPDTTQMRGLIWFDAATDSLKFYDGTQWRALSY